MDYLKFVEHHRATNADITIGCLPVDYERASDFGLMKIDDEGRIFVSACTPVPAHSPRFLLEAHREIFCDCLCMVLQKVCVLAWTWIDSSANGMAGLCREAQG